jgi:hypothetical protein
MAPPGQQDHHGDGATESRPSNPPRAPARNVAGRRRTSNRRNYSKKELMNFLGIMSELMPIGGDEWDEVLDRHSLRYPGREVDSLRRKFSQLHRKSTPTGDPVCPTEVKLAKRVKYQISCRADVGDGNEEMDLATGTFTNVHDLEDDDTDGDDDMEERLVDEVPGEFDPPSVPNDDLNLLDLHRSINRSIAQEEKDDESVKTSDLIYQPLPPRTTQGQEDTSSSIAATPPPGLAASLRASASTRQASAVSRRTPTRTTSPTRTRTTSPTRTATPTSRGSTSARPLVSPYDRRGNHRSNPQDGLAKMMEMSMVQHNQYMEVERQRRGEEREDRKAMQDMLAKVVTGAFESFNRYTKKNSKDEDDDDEE